MLEVNEVSVFDEGLTLLKDVSLVFPEGKTTVIIGGSGSGKSLLMKTASYIRPPEKGKVLWQGSNLGTISQEKLTAIRKTWGFMFQDSALWANMSIFENLALPQRFHFPDRSEKEIAERIKDLAEQMGFNGSMLARPVAYSAGRQKIASFMRAIINDPQLIFLDEPSTFVDHSGFRPVYRMLQRYRRQGRTIVMITHDIELAKGLGDHLMIMRSGELIASGDLHELLKSARHDLQQEIAESFQQGGEE